MAQLNLRGGVNKIRGVMDSAREAKQARMAAATSDPATIFTIHNLPYGVISDQKNQTKRCATVFEDYAVDLSVLYATGVFRSVSGLTSNCFAADNLNAFASLPTDVRRAARDTLKAYISATAARDYPAFIPLATVANHLPMDTKNYSDFYCSDEHGKNCSAVFGGVPSTSFYTIPSVYNGRTSSLCISGTPIRRPSGVIIPSMAGDPHDRSATPVFAIEPQFDFELEMGVFISKPVARGQRIKIADAKEHIFGFVLLNDWSARLIQFFEMQPLGPFHGKGSGTSISKWIVPIEALEDVAAGPRQKKQEPAPLEVLDWKDDTRATYDITVSAKILRAGKTYQITRSNLNETFWTPLQMITHLGSAGEGLSTGDIFGTGTLSSERTDDAGEKTGLACLWEKKLPHCATQATAPADIASTLLQDGDEVVFEAWCFDQRTGEVVLGFGECSGKVLPGI